MLSFLTQTTRRRSCASTSGWPGRSSPTWSSMRSSRSSSESWCQSLWDLWGTSTPWHPSCLFCTLGCSVLSVVQLQEGCGVINEVHFFQFGTAELEEMFTQWGHVPVCNQALPGVGFGVFKLGLTTETCLVCVQTYLAFLAGSVSPRGTCWSLCWV